MSNDDFLRAADPQGTAERRRIFCDCVGTLYEVEGQEGVNDLVIRYLIAAQKAGYEIIMFSTNPERSQDVISTLSYFDMRLREAPFDKVYKKSDYDGQEAFAVIDDDHEVHNLNATYEFSPADERLLEAIEHLDVGEPPKELRA